VPEERLGRLSQGINTSHWFAQAELTVQNYTTYITRADVQLIREMGFGHVRIPLDPDVLFTRSQPDLLHQQRIGYVDDAIQMILDEGLGVIVDLHPKSSFKEALRTDSAFVESVAQFWNALAFHLHDYDPDLVFLEVMNEPEFDDAIAWQRVQATLVAAMRAGAPRHTIIATGPRWSAPAELVRIQPLADPNVVYNFHFYTPHTFTHQGATWGWYAWEFFHDLPYPSSPQSVEPVLPQIDASVRDFVRTYGEERWDRSRLEEEIAQAVDWALQHGVRLTCNEFGVYRPVAPPDARLTWLRDVHEVFEQHGIGWTMWDYAGGFSVVNSAGTERSPDAATVAALGLVP
jgi:aryl-phospho-beta-D-glucosidase BglC (GH1 family)